MSNMIGLDDISRPQTQRFEDVAAILNSTDDVAIAKSNLAAGTTIENLKTSDAFRILSLVPIGHKFALRQIRAGESLRRYGQVIGFAKTNIQRGEHVHVHNLGMGEFARDYAFGVDVKPVEFVSEDRRRTFMGFRRADGRVGTRNFIAVISTVNCSAHVTREIAHHFSAERLKDFPNIDGVISIAHGSGCATRVGSDDYVILQRTLAGMASHPNVGAYLLVGLGCETNQISELINNHALSAKTEPRIKHNHPSSSHRIALQPPPHLNIQDEGGIRKTVHAGIEMIEKMLPMVNAAKREPCSVSGLTVALQCGGSDGWSGVTANPALGLACDELVRQGGSVVLAETPEIYGAEHLLTRRAVSREVSEKLVAKVKWWEKHAAAHNVEIDNNPSVGNKAGGLTTIYEKSLGAVAKAGSTPLVDVVDYAAPIRRAGFTFMDTPGYDPVGATGQAAGGCNLIVFTTGRGSVFGFKPTPSIKVATNSSMFNRMSDDMDVNAGKILEGVSMEEVGREIFELMIAVASGQQSKSEAQGVGESEFQPWNLGSTL
jgi:altronate hydrolase